MREFTISPRKKPEVDRCQAPKYISSTVSSWTKYLFHFILPSSAHYLCPELPPLDKGGSDVRDLVRHVIQIKEPLGKRWLSLQHLPLSPSANLPSHPIRQNCHRPWQGGLGRPDWLRQIRTELPGPGIKPVSPETHGRGDEVNTLKCGRRANEFGRGKPALNAYFGLH